MMNRRRHLRVLSLSILALIATLGVFLQDVRATNDENHISEIMAGANGNSQIQFIVMKQEGGGNLWGPQSGELQSRVMLVFYDGLGRQTGSYKFIHDAPAGTGGATNVLIATQAFANLPGAPSPNFIMPPLLNPVNGAVCFTNNPLTAAFFDRRDCLTYGTFAGNLGNNHRNGSTTSATTMPAPALPITATTSLKSSAPANPLTLAQQNLVDSNAAFSLTTSPTPQNDVSAVFTIPVLSQIQQGANLFNLETFGGNGRTCASCHVQSDSFRLTPLNIQTRFPSLSSTFDPQFIGETSTTGFDFNLNTLVLAGAVTSPQSGSTPCTGQLNGIITTSNGARAKVLTALEPAFAGVPTPTSVTYLIYGGFSPQLTGTVSDSNGCSGTVLSVTQGTLNQLESPARMRLPSTSPDFPLGRALILENVDGVTLPNVFRKSPHLLNLKLRKTNADNSTAGLGFSGDVPDLQTFSQNAVIQHLTRTISRASGTDFRLLTQAEKDAMAAFMQSIDFPPGASVDTTKLNLSNFALTPAQQRGQIAFFGAAKCSMCHGGSVLAQTTVSITASGVTTPAGVNGRFNTGIVNQAIDGPTGDNLPPEPASLTVGAPGSRQFSVPSLFNVGNLGPFFHDASVKTLRLAVEFYNSTAFQNSPAGQAIGGISLSTSMGDDIAAFLSSLSIGSVAANSPTTLSGPAGGVTTTKPSVLVLDANGNPVPGVTVTFVASTAQGGTVGGAVQITDATGVATVGNWLLAAGTNTLTATATGSFTGNPVTFTANGTAVALTSNDNFANRIALFGPNVTANGNNTGFTSEAGEPADGALEFNCCSDAGFAINSAWWTWTAPCNISVTQPTSFIDTGGSNFDTVLAVFTGSSLTGLTRIAVDNDSLGGGGSTSRVPSIEALAGLGAQSGTITISAGTVLQIRVRGFFGASGNIVLNIHTSCAGTPTLTAISPASGLAGSIVPVTLTGTNFATGGTTVTPSGTGVNVVSASINILSATSATAVLAIDPNAAQTVRSVTVTTGSGTSGPQSFTVTGGPPVIAALGAPIPGLSQDLAPFMGGPFTLAVNGLNFQSGATVSFAGTNLATTFINANQLTASVPASVLTSVGNKAIVVTNPGGAASNSINLKVVVRGDINADGAVSIGDALALSETIVGARKAPLSVSVGDIDINGVLTLNDSQTLASFTGGALPDFPVPLVTSVAPTSVTAGGTLTITGAGFAANASDNRVLFTVSVSGRTSVARVVPTTATTASLTVTVPVNAVSGAIQVYRMDGPLGGREFPITVTATATPLTLTMATPYFQVRPGTVLTLTGMGFNTTAASNTVTFKSATGIVTAPVRTATATSLTVAVPIGAVCGPVTVTTGGQTSKARMVTVPGTVCGLQLVDIPGGGAPGDTLVLEGSGFDPKTPANNIVTFTTSGGPAAASVLAAGRTQLQVQIPAGAITGNVTVKVGAATSNAFTYRTP